MREIEELAGLGTADVSVLTPKVIAAAIEEVARGKRVFAQFFKENRDLVNKPGLEIQFPKKQTGIAASWDVSPGSTISASSFDYDAVTIRVKKGGIRLEFTNEALEAAQRDVLRDHIYEAGLVWAETIDSVALDELLDLKQTIAVMGATVDVTYAVTGSVPIIFVDEVEGNTIDAVDYYGGTFYMKDSLSSGNATVTFRFSARLHSSGLYVNAKSAQTLSVWDILTARAKLVGKHRSPDVIVINDADLPGLLFDEKVDFLDKSAYGEEGLLNGEIGKIAGMKVVTTSRAPEGIAILIDTERLGYDVHKRDLRGYREDKPEYDAVWYHLWAERNFGVVNDDCVAVVVNCASGTYPGKKSA